MITKEKNIITIVDVNGKQWQFDINTGKWLDISILDNPHIVFSAPPSTTSLFCKYVVIPDKPRYFENNNIEIRAKWWEEEARYIRYIDICVSANAPILITDFSLFNDFGYMIDIIAKNIEEYKTFAKDFTPVRSDNEYNIPIVFENENGFGYDELVRWVQKKYIQNIIKEKVPHYSNREYTGREIPRLANFFDILEKSQSNKFNVYDFGMYYYVKLSEFCEIAGINSTYLITKYLDMCDKVNIPPRKESNFIKLLTETHKTYEMKLKAINAQKLVDIYSPDLKNLAFENDKYKIIIPQTEEEFEAEAKAQRNCVYTNYFPDLVNNNNTKMRIVFLREKENINKSFVTVEIHLNTSGKINQALKRFNEDIHIDETDLITFIEEYRQHLNSLYPVEFQEEENEERNEIYF